MFLSKEVLFNLACSFDFLPFMYSKIIAKSLTFPSNISSIV